MDRDGAALPLCRSEGTGEYVFMEVEGGCTCE